MRYFLFQQMFLTRGCRCSTFRVASPREWWHRLSPSPPTSSKHTCNSTRRNMARYGTLLSLSMRYKDFRLLSENKDTCSFLIKWKIKLSMIRNENYSSMIRFVFVTYCFYALHWYIVLINVGNKQINILYCNNILRVFNPSVVGFSVKEWLASGEASYPGPSGAHWWLPWPGPCMKR